MTETGTTTTAAGQHGSLRRAPAALALVVLVAALTTGGVARPAPIAAAVKPAKHVVGVRVVGGSGELYDRRSGKRFVARGANYIRLGPEGHGTFTVGHYDGKRAGAALARMRSLGYNAVRVFLGGECAGCPGAPGGGISRAYARNVADFLRRARKAGQFVILTTQWLPATYAGLIGDSPLVDDVNRIYLTDGGIQAYASFWRDLVVELRRQGAPLEIVLAFDIVNEGALVVNEPPFTLSQGTLVAPGGARYDLADPAAKERLLGDGLVVFGNRVRKAIRKVDPTALVSASYFVPTGPNPTRPGDVRDLRTRPVIERSQLDLVDVHAYPGFDLSLARTLQNFGLDGPTRKPVLIGEIGAFLASYPSAADGAAAIQAWQAESCAYGIDGWLLWTWDTDEQSELWNALSSGGVIASALAPRTRPDPCKAAPGSTNLALGRPTTASGQAPDAPAQNAVDGSVATLWSAGADAPQWIEIDLGQPSAVGAVRLVLAQFPAEGTTSHRVWTKGPDAGDGYVLRQTLSGTTRDGQTIEARSGAPWQGVRWVRVETIQSPSWVAWKEIRVIAVD